MHAAKSTGKEGGAPQPAEERWAEDGKKYTFEQFMEFYRADGYQYWKAARKVSGSASSHVGDVAHLAVASCAEQRIADDGNTYTKQEIKDYYGSHADGYWRKAQPIGDGAAQRVVLTRNAGAEHMKPTRDDALQLVAAITEAAATWHKEQTAANTKTTKPRPSSPLLRIDPAAEATAAKARSAARRSFQSFKPPSDIVPDI